MKRLIKNSFSILTSYFITMILFGIFSYAFIAIAKDNFNKWLPYYSGVFLFMLTALIYSDYKKMAIREKRPHYKLNPLPRNGFIYGLLGEIPLIILTVVGVSLSISKKINPDYQIVIINAVKVILGPLYLIYKIPSDINLGFTLALIFLPLISMAGYSAGLYNIEITLGLKKRYKIIKDSIIKKFKIEE